MRPEPREAGQTASAGSRWLEKISPTHTNPGQHFTTPDWPTGKDTEIRNHQNADRNRRSAPCCRTPVPRCRRRPVMTRLRRCSSVSVCRLLASVNVCCRLGLTGRHDMRCDAE